MTDIAQAWKDSWGEALAVWSKYTKLGEPLLCATTAEAEKEGLSGSFAMIRFADQRIVIDLQAVREAALERYATEILAHEIGHHTYAPASATDNFRMIARIRGALPTLERHVPLIANLYTDLLINDRLQRQSDLRMADIYRQLGRQSGRRGGGVSRLWAVYMRIYEQLWKLEKGSLCGAALDERGETDAWLGARVIRVYSREWLRGSSRFAALMLPYLIDDEADSAEAFSGLLDLTGAAKGCPTGGIIRIDSDEQSDALHPAEDPLVTGEDEAALGSEAAERRAAGESLPDGQQQGARGGQTREPAEFGEILKAAGIVMSDHDVAIEYYRERALPHILPYPKLSAPVSADPLPEGLDSWTLGEPFDDIDYLQSLIQSPTLIPGLTTVKRIQGTQTGRQRGVQAVDLDIYVDSSGSMPNPQTSTSYLTLAGAIIALSALRAGARVQVTLWSGKNEVLQSDGFVRDERQILSVLTGFFGGSTCFPIQYLRETYRNRKPTDRSAHILMISDDGITGMFEKDKKKNSCWEISAMAIRAARGGGTLALNLPDSFYSASWFTENADLLKRACAEQGWVLYRISDWNELLDFARDFARRHRDGLITSAKEQTIK